MTHACALKVKLLLKGKGQTDVSTISLGHLSPCGVGRVQGCRFPASHHTTHLRRNFQMLHTILVALSSELYGGG